jgi:hypothetical protein
MPDPISFPNQSNGAYGLEQNMCVAPPPVAATSAQRIAPSPSSSGPSSLSEGAQQLIAQHDQQGCFVEDLTAAGSCARAVLSTLGTVPSLPIAVANAFLGGVACGVAVYEATDCHLNER